MMRIQNLSRRGLLKGAASSGLLLGIQLDAAAAPKEPKKPEEPQKPAAASPFSPSVYIALDPSGQVTFTIHRSEMGQGIRTSLAMILADEMAASWQRITIRQAEGDPRYGDQDTDRSRSIRLFFTPMRQAGTAARQMLEFAAAQVWRASILDCRAVDHEVIHVPTGRTIGFGTLAKVAAELPVPPVDKLQLQDSSSHRYIGHAVPNAELIGMVRGKPMYGADGSVPGMKFASVERCPVYGGRVKSFEPTAALTVKGVEKVIEIPASPMPTGHLPMGGIAVIASNSWSAEQGRKKLKIEWDLGANVSHDTASYRAELEAAVRTAGRPVRSQGNFDPAYSQAFKKVAAEYYVPYQTHAMMEPLAAIAIPGPGGQMVIHAPTQNPQGARTVVAQYLGLKDMDVVVHPTLIGSAYGRKGMHDFVCEAAFLAKALSAPVKVQWTRADDMRHDFYHPMSVQALEGGVDKSGVLVAWRHRTAFPSITSTFKSDATSPDAAQLGEGFVDFPYLVANVRLEVASVPAYVRLGWYRSSMNIAHAFAACSFMDELAAAAGKDPGIYLTTMLAGPRKIDFKAMQVDYPNYGAPTDEYPVDVGRMQALIQYIMERSAWGSPLLPRQGRGIAVHRSYLSYAAAVAVVGVSPEGQVSIPRVDIALDCGTVINPDRVKAQLENAVMFGIGLTLYNDLAIKDGAVVPGNFDGYKMARASGAPEIHVHITPSGAAPGGVGDTGVPVIAPAICNAIYAACGKRIRALPIDPEQLRG